MIRRFVLLCLAVFCGGMAQRSLADEPQAPRYEYREDHDPNGLGKFYMGREIALVMGHQGIAWLERPQREQQEGLSQLIEALKLKPGMIVADIGAGSGVISVRMAPQLLPDGKVLAVDIQREMLRALENKCKQLGIENIQPVLGTTRSPGLEEGTVDLAIMVDVYHEFNLPYEMLKSISQAMKPGGRVVFVEYRKEDPRVPIKEVHKMLEAQVRREAEVPEMQLRWVETIDTLPQQHVIVFAKKSADDDTTGPAVTE